MLQKHSLTDRGLVVDALATVSISTCSDLVEEGTVDLIHLSTVDLGESFGHLDYLKNYKGNHDINFNKSFSLYYGITDPEH